MLKHGFLLILVCQALLLAVLVALLVYTDTSRVSVVCVGGAILVTLASCRPTYREAREWLIKRSL